MNKAYISLSHYIGKLDSDYKHMHILCIYIIYIFYIYKNYTHTHTTHTHKQEDYTPIS